MANGIIRTNPIGRFALWDMRADADNADAALGKEFWDAALAADVTITAIAYPIGDFSYSFSLSTATNVNVTSISYSIGSFSYALSLNVTDTITAVNYPIGQFSYAIALDNPEEFSLSYQIGNFTYALSLAAQDTITAISYPIGGFSYSLSLSAALSTATISQFDYQIGGFSYAVSLSTTNPVQVGISGGFALKKPRKRIIREVVEAALDEIDTSPIPDSMLEGLEVEIARAVEARKYTEELYAAIYARDLVQVRIGAMLQDIEDEEDLLLLS